MKSQQNRIELMTRPSVIKALEMGVDSLLYAGRNSWSEKTESDLVIVVERLSRLKRHLPRPLDKILQV